MSWLPFKSNQEILVWINQLLKSFDQIHQISLEFKHLDFFWFLIPILGRILKSSNKESCSLFNFLHIYILIENFWVREGILWTNSNLSQFDKSVNLETTLFLWAQPVLLLPRPTHYHRLRPMSLDPPPPSSLHSLTSRGRHLTGHHLRRVRVLLAARLPPCPPHSAWHPIMILVVTNYPFKGRDVTEVKAEQAQVEAITNLVLD
jgi:hypothetical protein